MIKPENTYAAWQKEKEQRVAWCALVDSALPPFERRAPRDQNIAEFLRSIGTPEALIGPVDGLIPAPPQPCLRPKPFRERGVACSSVPARDRG